MFSIARTAGCLAVIVCGLGAGQRCLAGEIPPAKERTAVEIGMPKSLFQGMPEFIMRVGAGPFKKMMKDSTGIDGNVQFPPDAMTVAKEINAGRIQIGVMQGHEFAWATSIYPTLTPIAVAVPLQPVQSFCLVKWDSKATNIGDLKNGKISLPPVHRDYSELFLAKMKSECMNGGSFAGQLNTADAADAIDQVGDGKSDCTVVDAPSLKWYQTVYPGRFQNVKILCQSEVFPNACIVVKKGELDDKTVQKFTKALIDAKDDSVGKPMLSTWKLKSFITVPAEYDAQIKTIEKAYPMPPTVRAAVDK